MARKIVESLSTPESILQERNELGKSNVLEIGPGRGVLTQILLKTGYSVTAVEIDPKLTHALQQKFPQNSFHLIHKDFLQLDFEELEFLNPKFGQNSFSIIGNLPYAVVSPIVQKFLRWKNWVEAVVMVQKEVGDRMMAPPGSKTYGILSIAVQSLATVEKILHVPRGCFRPIPNVENIVLKLKPKKNPLFMPSEEEHFFKVVRATFQQRRKFLANTIAASFDLNINDIRELLNHLGFSEKIRAEEISPENFKLISDQILLLNQVKKLNTPNSIKSLKKS